MSKPAPGHGVYPHLLRGLAVTRPNQAWGMDITYIRMARWMQPNSMPSRCSPAPEMIAKYRI
jgi:hypothetical protein